MTHHLLASLSSAHARAAANPAINPATNAPTDAVTNAATDAATTKAARRLLISTLLCSLLLFAHGARVRAQDVPATSGQGSVVAPTRTRASRLAAERPAPSAPGSIDGRIIDEQGQPIANVSVMATLRGAITIQRSPGAQSDDDGRFHLDNLEPGVYTLFAYVPGYALEPGIERTGTRYYRLGETATLTMIKGGVITGTVTSQTGDPLVGVNIYASFVRELDGSPTRVGQGMRGFRRDIRTDDRGIYRIYGLEPGIYVVGAGGPGAFMNGLPSAYEGDAPTFYPSGTRDTATEITVRSGQETVGIDIRYRGERGHAVSGTITGAIESTDFLSGVTVSLIHATTGTNIAMAFVSPRDNSRSFSFDGVADGDYDVTARKVERDGTSSSSPSQRISVRGSDVTGLKLTLTPMASISGSLILSPLAEAARAAGQCAAPPRTPQQQQQRLLPQETLVIARLDEREAAPSRARALRSESTPDAQGAFTIRNLDAGRFRLEARPLSEDWYLFSIQTPSNASASRQQNASRTVPGARPTTQPQSAGARAAASPTAPPPLREPFTLITGQRLSGVTLTLSEGASGLRGRVIPSADGDAQPLPARLRVHLVPSDAPASDDPLRFVEAAVNADGMFALTNLAPGRYRILALADTNEQDRLDASARPLAWDAEGRARLRREAEANGLAVELQPCQRVQDFTIRHK